MNPHLVHMSDRELLEQIYLQLITVKNISNEIFYN